MSATVEEVQAWLEGDHDSRTEAYGFARQLLAALQEVERVTLQLEAAEQDLHEITEDTDELSAEVASLRAALREKDEYVRALEDAALLLWVEMPTTAAKELALDVPALWDFCGHLHQSIEHEQAMVRVNVWADGAATREAGQPTPPANYQSATSPADVGTSTPPRCPTCGSHDPKHPRWFPGMLRCTDPWHAGQPPPEPT